MKLNMYMMKKPSLLFILYIILLIQIYISPIIFARRNNNNNVEIFTHCNKAESNNNFLNAISNSGYKLNGCFESLSETVNAASINSIVISLAPSYPKVATNLSTDIKNMVNKKNIKLYIEFGQHSINDYNVLAPTIISQVNLERVVVTSNTFFKEEDFYYGRLLNSHKSYFIDTKYSKTNSNDYIPLLVFSKVAGYNNCTLPDNNNNTYPLLYFMNNDDNNNNNNSNILYSTSKLSTFIVGRFSPYKSWTILMDHIFNFLLKSDEIQKLSYEPPTIQAMYFINQTLPSNANLIAVNNTINWFINAGMLSYNLLNRKQGNRIKVTNLNAYGKLGVIEGFTTSILPNGSQKVANALRDDCITETAMLFAMKHYLDNNNNNNGKNENQFEIISSNLLNYAWIHGSFVNGFFPRLSPDPNGDTFGLLKWDDSTVASISRFYKDDAARGILAGIATSSLLKTEKYNTILISTILANFRITGINGFGPASASFDDIIKNGWESYHNSDYSNEGSNYSPHYQSYLWAVYLWAYQNTQYQPFYNRAYLAIEHMMEHYPTYWIPTSNGITMQRARMLLPLAWLVNVNNTEKHVDWLHNVLNGLLERQDEKTGAIREEISAQGWNKTTRVPNNNDYGTFEAPLNQENTDPVSDLLYTSNFALIGLNEAYHCLQGENTTIGNALNKLEDFLIRIQSRSENKNYSGAYFRAFDFEKFEIWGSDADAGWGAFSVETGWTQTWIATALGLKHLNMSFWDITQKNVDLKLEMDGWVDYYF